MALPATSRGRRFGKYTLVAKLATGGMAEIFLARLQGDGGFEKLVCIKRILPHLAKDQHFVQMFLDEARVAARISHPNVCQVFELGETDGRYFIAMEYLQGVPLSCFRRADLYYMPPDPQLVVGMAMQACEGLHHAHQLKDSEGNLLEVVHRDVSPNNLFVTADGIVKVLDFGIAKMQDASVRTTTGAVKGTYAYMAPEQLRGERLDRRTDVFAMGIVMWETLAQRHLFRRDTDFLTFQAITTDPIPHICELRPELPPALGEAIMIAMSRDREGRYTSVRAFGEALARSVAPLGGPTPSSAVSEEISRAFETQLREQTTLLQVVQMGGALDLDDDIGPAVGHGTEMITTPVSSVKPKPTRRDLAVPAVTFEELTPALPPPAPRSATVQVQAAPPSRFLRILLVAATVLALSGVGLYTWNRYLTDGEAVSSAAVAPKPPPAEDTRPALGANAKIERLEPAVQVGSAHADSDEAKPAETKPAEPVKTEPAVAVTPPTQSDKHPPKPPPPPPPKPSGPPGYITLDSTPVYAVIFVDGKRLGETPLVHIELPPGKHVVRAVSASGTTRSLPITIESGKTAPTRRIEW
jgi:eukaryotic-like serine/threonine-protein kinase